MPKVQIEKSIKLAAAFAELEKIVDKFENGDVDLDEGLAQFERGLELAQHCKVRLKEVENKVVQIKRKFEE